MIKVAVDVAEESVFGIAHSQLVNVFVPHFAGLDLGYLKVHTLNYLKISSSPPLNAFDLLSSLVDSVQDDVEAFHAAAQREILHIVGVFELEFLLFDSIRQIWHIPLHERLIAFHHVPLEVAHERKVPFSLVDN